MPLYVGDYLADTQHLTISQSGAYLHLIMAYWSKGKALPDDDGYLSAICRMTKEQWRQARPIVEEFFDRESNQNLWVHQRIEEELGKAVDKRVKRAELGKKGAAVRWQKP